MTDPLSTQDVREIAAKTMSVWGKAVYTLCCVVAGGAIASAQLYFGVTQDIALMKASDEVTRRDMAEIKESIKRLNDHIMSLGKTK